MDLVYSQYFSETFIDCFLRFSHSLRSKRSVQEYLGSCRIICDYLHKDFLEITETDADQFFQYMRQRIQEGSLKLTTLNGRLSVYNAVSKFISESSPELGFENPFYCQMRYDYTAAIRPSTIPSLKEIDSVMEAAKEESPMYYLILSLAFRVALSATDIVSLKTSDLQVIDDRMTIVFPSRKQFSPDRVIPLPEDVSCLLEDYISALSYKDEIGHLFYNKFKNPLTVRNLDSMIAKLVKKSGLQNKYTLKDFRSRAILDMLKASMQNDVPPQSVANYVGIKDLRLNSYVSAKNIVEECPADLVNLRVMAPQ